jgi:hypothetical protein
MAVDTVYAWLLRESATAVTVFLGDDHGRDRLS